MACTQDDDATTPRQLPGHVDGTPQQRRAANMDQQLVAAEPARAAGRKHDGPQPGAGIAACLRRGADATVASGYHWRTHMTEPMRKEYAKLRRRPFLTPLWLTVSVSVVALALAAWALVSASTTTLIVIRHAEATRSPDKPDKDPPLSLAGELRAARLADVFASSAGKLALDGVVVSAFRRSQDTARPLANALGIPVIVESSADPAVISRRALGEFRGGRVLIVGHADTVPAIVGALTGDQIPPMAETDFGTLYVVSRPQFSRATVTVLHLP